MVPSAFHANEGATGIRWLYLDKMALRCCYSFENRRALFEIHRSFKFALVVARAGGPTTEFSCAFYLHDDEWLFAERNGRERLRYTYDFVRRTGGERMTLLEIRSRKDLEVTNACFENGDLFQRVCTGVGVTLGRELNMSDDAWRFTPVDELLPAGVDPREPLVASELRSRGYVILQEGKAFWQFDDKWGDRTRYLIAVSSLSDRPYALRVARYYRGAYRDISSSTNERTLVYGFLCPGCVIGDTATAPERAPENRPNSAALMLVTVCSAFCVDFLVRLRAASHVSLFILNATPLPRLERMSSFWSHCGLRLSSNHSGYGPFGGSRLGIRGGRRGSHR